MHDQSLLAVNEEMTFLTLEFFLPYLSSRSTFPHAQDVCFAWDRIGDNFVVSDEIFNMFV